MPIFWKSMREIRVQILAYGVGLAAYAAMMTLLFPSFSESIGNIELPPGFEAVVGGSTDFSSPEGFFGTELFPWIPLIIAIFGITVGTGATAGEESTGTIDSILALPFSRETVVMQKTASLAVGTAIIVAMMMGGFLVTIPLVDLGGDLPLWKLPAASLAALPFAWFTAGLALFLGAVAPSRGTATGIASALVIATWLATTVAGLADPIEWVQYLSPYYYSDVRGILVDGVTWWHPVLNLALTLALVALAVEAFAGREIGAARWQFSAILGTRLAPVPEADRVVAPSAGPAAGDGAPGADRVRVLSGRRLALIGAVLLLLGGAGGTVAALTGAFAPGERTVAVDGYVNARSVEVLAPTSGVIRLVEVVEGSRVSAGDPIAWLADAVDDQIVPVTATAAGTLTRLTAKTGGGVVVGSTLGTIVAVDDLEFVLVVPEDDISAIARGQRVTATITAIDLDADTRVGAIALVPVEPVSGSTKSSKKVTYEVRAPLGGGDPRIAVGMRVKADIHIPPPAGDER